MPATIEIQSPDEQLAPAPPRRRVAQRHLNLPFLVGSLVTLAIAGTAVWLLHGYQVERLAGSLLERADRLEADGDHAKAADYLFLYLQIHPDDRDVLVRMAGAADRKARTWSQKSSAVHWHYRALGFAPERMDLRCRLAELLLDIRRHVPAQEAAEEILKIEPANKVGLRVKALARHQLYESTGLDDLDSVLAALKAAHEAAPAHIDVATSLADFYRRQMIQFSEIERSKMADAVMDRLVASSGRGTATSTGDASVWRELMRTSKKHTAYDLKKRAFCWRSRPARVSKRGPAPRPRYIGKSSRTGPAVRMATWA